MQSSERKNKLEVIVTQNSEKYVQFLVYILFLSFSLALLKDICFGSKCIDFTLFLSVLF